MYDALIERSHRNLVNAGNPIFPIEVEGKEVFLRFIIQEAEGIEELFWRGESGTLWQVVGYPLFNGQGFIDGFDLFKLNAPWFVLAQRELDFRAVCDKPSRTEESPCARHVTITPPRRKFSSSSVTWSIT
jgi:hypothetical protein